MPHKYIMSADLPDSPRHVTDGQAFTHNPGWPRKVSMPTGMVPLLDMPCQPSMPLQIQNRKNNKSTIFIFLIWGDK